MNAERLGRRTARLVVAAGILAGCGTSGNLRIPVGGSATSASPLAVLELPRSCASFSQSHIFHLASRPPGLRDPYCARETTTGAADVLYIPVGLNVDVASRQAALDAGGVVLSTATGLPPVNIVTNKGEPGGGYEAIRVQGLPAIIQRAGPREWRVSWDALTDGVVIRVLVVCGNRTETSARALAETVRPGSPTTGT